MDVEGNGYEFWDDSWLCVHQSLEYGVMCHPKPRVWGFVSPKV
jgi:hypothetical protein